MTVLAIDTALDACAAAVIDADGICLAETTEVIGRGHAERLMPMLEDVLARAGVAYGDLTRVVVTVGPGSFTGIRVGVAAARGLALALGIPAVGVTTLDAHHAHARRLAGTRPLAILYDARRGEVYGRLFGATGAPLGDPFALSAATVADVLKAREGPAGPIVAEPTGWTLAGSGAALVAEALGDAVPILDTNAFAPITTIATLGQSTPPGPAPRPLYIRPPDAKPQEKARVAWA